MAFGGEEWLAAEVRAAQEAFNRLPGWKKAILRSKDEQTRHSFDRDSRGSCGTERKE